MNDVFAVGLVLLGMLIASIFAWLFSRGRLAAEITAALAESQRNSQLEIASLKERVRQSDQDRQSTQAALEKTKQDLEQWRETLSVERAERAKMSERVERVLALESELAGITERLRLADAEVLRVSTSEAQKAQSVRSLSEHASQLEAVKGELERKLFDTSAALHDASERRALLEEPAGRVVGLEQRLRDSEKQISELNALMAESREAGARTASQLTAELKAERDAIALARGDLANERQARAASDAATTRKLELAVQRAEALGNQLAELRELSGRIPSSWPN